MGIYCFEPHVLHELMVDESKTDSGKEIIPEAIGKLKVMAYPFSGYWRAIGTIAVLLRGQPRPGRYKNPPQPAPGAWPFYTRTRAPPARIMESTIENSAGGRGRHHHRGAHRALDRGIRARIRKGAFLKDVIHMGPTSTRASTCCSTTCRAATATYRRWVSAATRRLERCIIDKNARIGDGVIIRAQPDVKEHPRPVAAGSATASR
ncbi:MAG: hypothetical protein IPO18_07445 [bacterium]|nr:hypothetical protein [bacterium]